MSPHGDYDHMGDAGVTTEREILDKYNLLNIDVLKVGQVRVLSLLMKLILNIPLLVLERKIVMVIQTKKC